MLVRGTGVPAAQNIFLCMDEVDVATTWGGSFKECSHNSFWHCNCSKHCSDRAIWEKRSHSKQHCGPCVTACTETFYMEASGSKESGSYRFVPNSR